MARPSRAVEENRDPAAAWQLPISAMIRYASFFGSGDCPVRPTCVTRPNDGTKRSVWPT